MTVPNYGDKYDEPAHLTPEAHVRERRRDEQTDREFPDAVLVCFQRDFFDWLAATHGEPIETPDSNYRLLDLGDGLGAVGEFGIGAPAAAAEMEELIALGVETFLVLGGCATLQPDASGRELLLADRAIRDEGTSHHYLEPATYVEATPGLVEAVERAADDRGVPVRRGPTWTTDALFRETVAEVEHYADEGVLAVEMEAAALFAVAEYRNVEAAAGFAAFDCLTADEWQPYVDETENRLRRLYPVARDALLDRLD